jgi:thioesterase domain-containing protein
LAETISKTETAHPAQSVIVPIQPDGTRPPLFLVHGAGGDVLWGYANMAKHVSADQPMFGIQARPGENPERFATLEEMAAEYVVELRAAHPHGPYSLGGYCFGGTVAYEMARQLRELGEEVADVILLEATPSGGTYERVFWWWLDFPFRFTRNLYHWWCDYCEMTVEERRSLVRRKMKLLPRKIWRWVRRAKGERTDLEDVIDTAKFQSHERRLWEIHLALLEAHKSQPYDGHVTVFRTASHPLFSSYENDLGWSALVEDRVMVHVVPGSHGHIFLEPHVRTLAEALDKVLAANAAPHTEPTRELLAA